MNLHQEIMNYAILAAAHILPGLPEDYQKRVNNIVLFGSAAQLRAFEESDVDIFIDTDAPATIQKKIRSCANKSIESWKISTEALEFKTKRIDNSVSIIVGKLGDWKDLKRSMLSSGIVLYGKYSSKIDSKEMNVIFSWENLGKHKGAILNKFYGYRSKEKKYPGLLKKLHGRKIGRGTIIVPIKNKDPFIFTLEKYKIDYSMFEVWE